jgi:predicted dehydrogenase
LRTIFLALLMTALSSQSFSAPPAAGQARLIIVDPGHFHATLIQKDMYPSISPRVSVYAPLSPELLDYLNRISLFNSRKDNPTSWELDVHTGPGFFERMLGDRPGDVVVFTGRNRGKIDRIQRSLEAGFHVFADKPWIIASADLPKLASALDMAERKGLAAYDIMTERFEITSLLQRELVNTPEVFGQMVQGSAAEPAVKARSIHHLMKLVAGVPIRRPVWFFDIHEYGEALADVGTHVVDLVQWTAFPEKQLDYRSDVEILSARHWPTVVTQAQFRQVTGEADFPPELSSWVKARQLDYYSNNFVHYTVRGIHVELDILWNWEAPEGAGDVYEAAFRGTEARVEIRQGKAEKFAPELYVVPNSPAGKATVLAALERKVRTLETVWPGVAVQEQGGEARLVIPDRLRVGHEAHFAQVANRFFQYRESPPSIPAWEKASMLVKYFISTRGVELGR